MTLPVSHNSFTLRELNIIQWCANEVHRQDEIDAALCVPRMLNAWKLAATADACNLPMNESLILKIANAVDPTSNKNGYRKTPVMKGMTEIGDKPGNIQRQMELLLESTNVLTIDEFVKGMLDCHPFANGNGRTASIVYNYLTGDLLTPQPLPNYYKENN